VRSFSNIILLLLLALTGTAQYHVTFRLTQRPPGDTARSVYLVGSFNNWDPGLPAYRLVPDANGSLSLTLTLPRGQQEFKLTKGSWATGEVAASGKGVDNRIFFVTNDTTMNISIEQWAHHFPSAGRHSTATRQVQVIDTAFFIPQLNRHRRIWICLPADYATSKEKYPVLYMQDGQNLFDDATSAYGEWGVDEAMDTLGPQYGHAIIVGIDHGGSRRINEYSPYDMEKYGKGEGDQYVDFMAQTLKPFIDRHYRTRKEAAHTFVAGSSMGGLISFHAILKYPKVFGAAGVFSPAFWITPQLKTIDPKKAKALKGKIYFYAGAQESEHMVTDMLSVFGQLRRYSKAKMETVIRAEGRHSEATWRAEFPLFYEWLMKK
jgi:predicted alpha/beta superfamily hydrolase